MPKTKSAKTTKRAADVVGKPYLKRSNTTSKKAKYQPPTKKERKNNYDEDDRMVTTGEIIALCESGKVEFAQTGIEGLKVLSLCNDGGKPLLAWHPNPKFNEKQPVYTIKGKYPKDLIKLTDHRIKGFHTNLMSAIADYVAEDTYTSRAVSEFNGDIVISDKRQQYSKAPKGSTVRAIRFAIYMMRGEVMFNAVKDGVTIIPSDSTETVGDGDGEIELGSSDTDHENTSSEEEEG